MDTLNNNCYCGECHVTWTGRKPQGSVGHRPCHWCLLLLSVTVLPERLQREDRQCFACNVVRRVPACSGTCDSASSGIFTSTLTVMSTAFAIRSYHTHAFVAHILGMPVTAAHALSQFASTFVFSPRVSFFRFEQTHAAGSVINFADQISAGIVARCCVRDTPPPPLLFSRSRSS